MVAKKRYDYIDIFRAIGILLMVMGHIYFGKHFDFYIHAFHMPIFFIVSGYFFKADEVFTVFLNKKFKTLIIPYLVFGLLNYVLYSIFNYFIVHKALSADPLKHLLFVNTNGLYAGAMWFLTSLFFAEVFLYFLLKMKAPYRYILIPALAIMGNLAPEVLPSRLPYALDAAFTGTGLLLIGYLVRQFKDSAYVKRLASVNTKLFIPKLLICAVASVLLIRCNSYVNMRLGQYGVIPLFWANVVLASYVVMLVSRQLDLLLKGRIKKYVTDIGRYSIVYLCLNQIVIKCVAAFNGHFISGHGMILLVRQVLTLIVTMFILWVCSRVITSGKLRMVLGK